jgi:ubiquinone/menaquinone biosynthesis C-methylase UbiE
MTKLHTAFVGSIPEHYDRYLGPLIFEAYAVDLAKGVSVPSGGIVLETAAGTGIATCHLRNLLPLDVKIVATDLNEAMLNVAQAKVGTHKNIEFRLADAMQLQFGHGSFDAVVCQFGIMFFPDKVAAMREVIRVLKPGGTFLFNVWDSYEHNHLVHTVNKTIARHFPNDPPLFYDVPYGYNHLDEIKRSLGEAGFGDIDIAVQPRASTCEKARHVALGYVLGTPVQLQIEERSPESLSTIVNAVEHAINNTYGPNSIRAKMQAITFKAHYSVNAVLPRENDGLQSPSQ